MRIPVLVERLEDPLESGRVHRDRDSLLPGADERDVVVRLEPVEEAGVVLLERLRRLDPEVDDGLPERRKRSYRVEVLRLRVDLRRPRDVADDLRVVRAELLERPATVVGVNVHPADGGFALLPGYGPFEFGKLSAVLQPDVVALHRIAAAVFIESAELVLAEVTDMTRVHQRPHLLGDLLPEEYLHRALEVARGHQVGGEVGRALSVDLGEVEPRDNAALHALGRHDGVEG